VTPTRTIDPAERIAELEEEVAYLKGELRLADDEDRCLRLRNMFKLSPYEGRALERLYRSYPRPVAAWKLIDTPAENEADMGRVYACRLRKALPAQTLMTIWGTGYLLSEKGYALLAEVLEPDKVLAA
jgi:DNA-binding response OmpR family regulator